MAKLNQEQLLEIFNALKKEIKPYEKGVMVPNFDIEGKYDLSTTKQVFAQGKSRDGFSFVGIIVQSGYVGFYYMPVYTNPDEVKPLLATNLLKTLKGKSCFHIKKVDKDLLASVKAAMKLGYEQYKKNGWL